MTNRQRCKLEHSAEGRQLKSKNEEDWAIMNKNTILFTIAMWNYKSKKYSILGKQVRKIPVVTSWAV